MIELMTRRLIVRDAKRGDLNGWHRLKSDSRAMFYVNDMMTHSPEESRKDLDAAIAEAENPTRIKYFFTIELIQTGAFVGSIGYTVKNVTPMGRIVDAGYFLLPEYHGCGYATEAFSEVMRFVFEEGDVYRLTAGCFLENRASERVMQKCGMIKEAEFKACSWHDGRMKDRVAYRLLKEEWAKRHAFEVGCRLATPSDAEALKRLNDLFNGEGCNSAVAIAESLRENRREIVCVAEKGERLIGFCCGQVTASMCYSESCGEITELFVEEGFRRLGAGGALMRLMESELLKRGAAEIKLLTGNANEAAQQFYRALGYREKSEVLFSKPS